MLWALQGVWAGLHMNAHIIAWCEAAARDMICAGLGRRTRGALWHEILTPEYAFISRHKFNCVDVRNIFTLAILSCAR